MAWSMLAADQLTVTAMVDSSVMLVTETLDMQSMATLITPRAIFYNLVSWACLCLS